MTSAALIGVDWGTTNLRAWLMDSTGDALDQRSSSEGMASLQPDAFAGALERLTQGWPDRPVLVCGMAGARQGWIEAPYISSPATAESLAANLTPAPVAREVWIIPGVAVRDSDGRLADVMRGEETQAIGLSPKGRAMLICPGTHSKWIRMELGAIQDFKTFMTGELHALLGTHSVLRSSIGAAARLDNVFREAVRDMLDGQQLSAALFSVRVRSLDSRATPQECASRLSGLLIGAEIKAGAAQFGRCPIKLAGSGGLSALYAGALREADFDCLEVVDGSIAARAGLLRIWNAHS